MPFIVTFSEKLLALSIFIIFMGVNAAIILLDWLPGGNNEDGPIWLVPSVAQRFVLALLTDGLFALLVALMYWDDSK